MDTLSAQELFEARQHVRKAQELINEVCKRHAVKFPSWKYDCLIDYVFNEIDLSAELEESL